MRVRNPLCFCCCIVLFVYLFSFGCQLVFGSICYKINLPLVELCLQTSLCFILLYTPFTPWINMWHGCGYLTSIRKKDTDTVCLLKQADIKTFLESSYCVFLSSWCCWGWNQFCIEKTNNNNNKKQLRILISFVCLFCPFKEEIFVLAVGWSIIWIIHL